MTMNEHDKAIIDAAEALYDRRCFQQVDECGNNIHAVTQAVAAKREAMKPKPALLSAAEADKIWLDDRYPTRTSAHTAILTAAYASALRVIEGLEDGAQTDPGDAAIGRPPTRISGYRRLSDIRAALTVRS